MLLHIRVLPDGGEGKRNTEALRYLQLRPSTVEVYGRQDRASPDFKIVLSGSSCACSLECLAGIPVEERDLQSQVATLQTANGIGQGGAEENSLIRKARQHAEKAGKLIKKGDFKGSKVEIEKSLHLLEEAGKDAAAPPTAVLDKLRQSIDELRAIADRTWQQKPKNPPLDKKR